MSGNSLAAVAAEAAEGASKPSAPATSKTTQRAAPPAAEKPEAAAAAPAETGKAPDLDAVRQEAATAERSRLMALDQIALPGCEKIIESAKTEGKTPETAALEMVRHLKATGQLDISRQMATAADSVPAVDDAPHDPVKAGAEGKAPASTPEGWKAEWEKSAALQREFSSADTYVAYKKAECAGRIRVLTSAKED